MILLETTCKRIKKEDISIILSTFDVDINLCKVIYDSLKTLTVEEQNEIFKTFIIGAKRLESDNPMKCPEHISKEDAFAALKQYGSYVDKKLEDLIQEQADEDTFYNNLSDFIFNNPILENSDIAGAAAIYNLVIDRRLPYHQVDISKTIRMEKPEFRSVCDKIGKDTFEKLNSTLLYEGFSQRTERAGAVLGIIESCETREEQVIMLSMAFTFFDEYIKFLIKRDMERKLLESLAGT